MEQTLLALFDLYDQEGILRFTGCDRDACLDYAKLFSLALIHLPSDEDNINQGIQALKDDLLDKTVKINVEYK